MTIDVPARASYKEIDLYGFCLILWKSKLLVFTITIIAVGIAAAYAFLAPPVYTVSARLLPPTIQDLAGYNLAAQITSRGYEAGYQNPAAPNHTQITTLTATAAYNGFLRNLNSSSVKLYFFKKVYLPAYGNTTDIAQQQALWVRMNKELGISLPSNPLDPASLVTLQGHNPEMIASMVNKYVAIAVDTTKASFIKGLDAQVKVRRQAVDSQIKAYQQIVQMGLKSNSDGAMKVLPPGGDRPLGSGTVDATLRNLLTQKALLSSINLNPSDFAVTDIDHAADTSTKILRGPKKMLAMILGVVLGFMLGILVTVIRSPFTP